MFEANGLAATTVLVGVKEDDEADGVKEADSTDDDTCDNCGAIGGAYGFPRILPKFQANNDPYHSFVALCGCDC